MHAHNSFTETTDIAQACPRTPGFWSVILKDMPIHLIDKPLGLTSHDVVAQARKHLKTRRIGHTGTLDPLATGVLMLCSGPSTKLVQFLTADSKDYLAFISLGATTATLDAEGPLTHTSIPDLPSDTDLEAICRGFIGKQMQIPPQYSAISVQGQRAHEVARSGGTVELKARAIEIFAMECLGCFTPQDLASLRFEAPESAKAPWRISQTGQGQSFERPPLLGSFQTLVVWVSVSSGTYIRSLARDLGDRLGTQAFLSGLVRTRVGRFTLAECTSIENIDPMGIADLDALDLPILEADDAVTHALRCGQRPKSALEGTFVATHRGSLVAVVQAQEGHLKVLRAWAD